MLTRSLLPRPHYFDHYCFSGNGEPDSGGGSGGGNDNDNSDDGNAGDPPARTFTQQDLDRAASARAAAAKREAERSLAEALGVSIEEAKTIIAEARKKDDDAKSDAEKARDEANRAKAEADKAKAEAQQERMAARIERALVKNKVRDDRLDSSVKLLEIAPDATDEEVAAAVETFKESTPEFFGDGTDDGKPNGGLPPSDPKTKPDRKRSEDAYTRGIERAKARSGGGTYAILENQN